MFEEAAKERMLSTQNNKSGKAASANLQKQVNPIHAHEQAAKLLNVSPRSVESASRVLEHGAPELAQAVDEGKLKVSIVPHPRGVS